jgi:Mg-chelatase subunit ChlI
LLDDHLVDVLLDSAAMGVNSIEREGISISHPSRFILVGTMNPEEGEIRPQLLDRFGLSVNVKGLKNPKERMKIIKLVEDFEQNPESVSKIYDNEQAELRKRIMNARALMNAVEIPADVFTTIINICIEFEVHGHRADFLIARTSKTIAAYNQRKTVNEDDVIKASELVLPHRMRRLPFEEPQPVTDKVKRIVGQRRPTANVVSRESHEVGRGEVAEVRLVSPVDSQPSTINEELDFSKKKSSP